MNNKPINIPHSFYLKPPLKVAMECIGLQFRFYDYAGIIVETEAYSGTGDDPSAHSHGCKKTKRNEVMFHEGGRLYVYLSYGIYWCTNIVVQKENIPDAVLIRGIVLTHYKEKPIQSLWLNGPGKVCHKIGITHAHNNLSLIDSKNVGLYTLQNSPTLIPVPTKRIGISKATHLLWRYVIPQSVLKKQYPDISVYKIHT